MKTFYSFGFQFNSLPDLQQNNENVPRKSLETVSDLKVKTEKKKEYNFFKAIQAIKNK